MTIPTAQVQDTFNCRVLSFHSTHSKPASSYLGLIRLDDLWTSRYTTWTIPWNRTGGSILASKVLNGPVVCVATLNSLIIWNPQSGISKTLQHQSLLPPSFHSIHHDEPVVVQMEQRTDGEYLISVTSLDTGHCLYTTRLLLAPKGEPIHLVGMDVTVDSSGWVNHWVVWTRQGDFYHGHGATRPREEGRVSTVTSSWSHSSSPLWYLGKTYQRTLGRMALLTLDPASQHIKALEEGGGIHDLGQFSMNSRVFGQDDALQPFADHPDSWGCVVTHHSSTHQLDLQAIFLQERDASSLLDKVHPAQIYLKESYLSQCLRQKDLVDPRLSGQWSIIELDPPPMEVPSSSLPLQATVSWSTEVRGGYAGLVKLNNESRVPCVSLEGQRMNCINISPTSSLTLDLHLDSAIHPIPPLYFLYPIPDQDHDDETSRRMCSGRVVDMTSGDA
ncbi:MAG: hypothetical protein DHS80DRAFT_32490 [Piptocephalis tieghemiana]|nr:MAG: hypothetical protein DHS80DRAFT_32490 [Piptocephalis tieghemiana]